eukprot:2202000-Amphidinium_carterae.2
MCNLWPSRTSKRQHRLSSFNGSPNQDLPPACILTSVEALEVAFQMLMLVKLLLRNQTLKPNPFGNPGPYPAHQIASSGGAGAYQHFLRLRLILAVLTSFFCKRTAEACRNSSCCRKMHFTVDATLVLRDVHTRETEKHDCK